MLEPGSLLNDRYLLERKLGRGGFGVAFLAKDQKLHDKLVVVKMPITPVDDDPDFQEWLQNRSWYEKKFNSEIVALALIDHPGVVAVLDSGATPAGQPFLVMQYIDGQPLKKLITPAGLPLERVASLVHQLGNALGAVHDKGVWHRDLKPENIMVETLPEGDRARLIDFGLATVSELQSKTGRVTTRVAGSLAYMAPEQILAQPVAASDVYALGVIAFELATGRMPFTAGTHVQLYLQQQQGVQVKPRDLKPHIPQAAEALILQALLFDPGQRPTSARLFGSQLAAALMPESHPAPPQPSRVLTNPIDKLAYVYLPAGEFYMGCSPGDPDCYEDEKPRHKVALTKGFWMAQTPVTVAAYLRYIRDCGRLLPDPPTFNRRWADERQPMINITWDEASSFCRWSGGRLPTEAEWEYAARAGTESPRYGPMSEIGWYDLNSGERVRPVGEKLPNAFDLYDMLGNVWEWCEDWHGGKQYESSAATDPAGPPSGHFRVLRGGCWNFNVEVARASSRLAFPQAHRGFTVGFRCVRDVSP